MASPSASSLLLLLGLTTVIVAVTPPQSTSFGHFLEVAMPPGTGFSPATNVHSYPEPREVDELEDFDFDDSSKVNQELRVDGRRYNPRYDYDDFMTRLEQDEDPLNPRCAPPSPQDRAKLNGERGFVITPEELNRTRSQFMYWFFDKCSDSNPGDRQKDIHTSNGQIHKNLNFQLPFFGFRFNYTRVSMNGYLEFSDPPATFTYPLVFPTKDWPNENDPSFIGIFFSKCRIGKIRQSDIDKREPGVYFRMERDLHGAKDKFGVMVRERLMWDIRTGVVGAETFIPKHAIFVTWKNVSFAGGIDSSLYITNTFQLILATDEVMTYAIFNYLDMQWTTHTEASGDTTRGEGGTPAYVGFNAGNGTRSYEYKPYSQFSTIRDLTNRGWVNGFPGRHIFRIDEKIMLGNCNKDLAGANLDLVFAPESGNMLGGTVVNITGPCFNPGEKIICRFDDFTVQGTRIDSNRAICVQPYLMAEGYVRFEVSIGNNQFNYKGKYFVETPATANERITFQSEAVHRVDDSEIKISWVPHNLTANTAASVKISLYGYRERTIHPELIYIDTIEEGVANTGSYIISPSNFRNRDNYNVTDLQFGFLQISLVNPAQYSGLSISPLLWSKPIPLGWYFKHQWQRMYGKLWPETLCNEWTKNDRYLKSFAAEISQCPCTLEQALADKGTFMPDFECDRDINSQCFYHRTAIHCVRSGTPSKEGSGQECCYNKEKYLMMSYDQMWGSSPHRSHNLGQLPWNEANKVPTLSQWFHDLVPFYTCCLWQDEQSVGCETLRFERRPTQDCVSYQSPAIAAVFGDPHIITFDDLEYTFNGKGEFVLVHVDSQKLSLEVQGRFEQAPPNIYGEVSATQLTAIAAQSNSSTVIEVRLRPPYAQSRYRLDVLADKKMIFFDRPALKIQHFPGVTVYTPSAVLDQSEVVIMFHSGVGVEVTERKGFVSARVFLPWTFLNLTRGLFGNWSFDMTDDFVLPDGRVVPVSLNTNSFERVHKDFGIHWLLEDRYEKEKGNALFLRENGRLASYYANRTFVPEYRASPQFIIPLNRSEDIAMAEQLCGECYQCQYDYAVTLNRDLAYYTLSYYTEAKYFKSIHKNRVLSCGVLETPRFGRKSTFMFTPDTKVIFECDQGFILVGDKRRTCLPDGRWNIPDEFTQCLYIVEYERIQAWISIGTIMAVMFTVTILLLVAWRLTGAKWGVGGVSSNATWSFKRSPKNRLSERSAVPSTSQGPEGQPLSRAPDNDYDSDPGFGKGRYEPGVSVDDPVDSEGGSTPWYSLPKKRRTYDGVYHTHEPLPGRPLIEFEDKLWDLDEALIQHSSPSNTDSFETTSTARSQRAERI